jgi:hypothetical protein
MEVHGKIVSRECLTGDLRSSVLFCVPFLHYRAVRNISLWLALLSNEWLYGLDDRDKSSFRARHRDSGRSAFSSAPGSNC